MPSDDEEGDWLVVPGSEPLTIVPVDYPEEMDGFRIARWMDGVDDRGLPRVSPERGYVRDRAERDRLLAYLHGGALVVRSMVRGRDLLEPTRHFAVPGHVYTDGAWIWQENTAFYLRWHGVAPEPDLYRHIVAHGYRPREVAPEVVAAADRAIRKARQILETQRDAWLRERGMLIEGDEDRFPPEVNRRLLDLGWYRGRDVSDRVTPWLDYWVTTLMGYGPGAEKVLPYESFPAADAALHEFGELVSWDDSPGVSAARTPFAVYPNAELIDPESGDERMDDLLEFHHHVHMLGTRLGKKTFQVGHIQDREAALVIDEDGAVYACGSVDLYLGASFDRALITMLEGHEAEPV